MSVEINYASDIHLEFVGAQRSKSIVHDLFPAPFGNDHVLILAGDIGQLEDREGIPLRTFLKACTVRFDSVVYILGNHEYYSKASRRTPKEILFACYKRLEHEFPNLRVLDNQMTQLHQNFDLKVFGATLWSRPTTTIMNDRNMIWLGEGKHPTPADYTKWNTEALDELTRCISTLREDEKLVVVTHFPPIQEGTSANKYRDQPQEIKSYFANHLGSFIRQYTKQIPLWICGHTHLSFDFIVPNTSTRIVSNAVGYPLEETGVFKSEPIALPGLII